MLLEWVLGAGMGAQAAQASWQLPTLPPDTVGGTEPGETGKENPKEEGGGVCDILICHLPRGQRNCQTRGKGIGKAMEPVAELGTVLGTGNIAGGTGMLRHCCGVGTGTSEQPVPLWREG